VCVRRHLFDIVTIIQGYEKQFFGIADVSDGWDRRAPNVLPWMLPRSLLQVYLCFRGTKCPFLRGIRYSRFPVNVPSMQLKYISHIAAWCSIDSSSIRTHHFVLSEGYWYSAGLTGFFKPWTLARRVPFWKTQNNIFYCKMVKDSNRNSVNYSSGSVRKQLISVTLGFLLFHRQGNATINKRTFRLLPLTRVFSFCPAPVPNADTRTHYTK